MQGGEGLSGGCVGCPRFLGHVAADKRGVGDICRFYFARCYATLEKMRK